MPKTAQEVFKDGLDKAYTSVNLNQGTMTDYASYRQGVKEDETEDETPMIRRSIKKFLLNKKKETKDETGHSKYYPGGKTPGLTTDVLNTILTNMGKGMKSDKNEVTEKWSEKYKKSINCSNPKGFSQKAHCDGKKKETKEATGSGSSGAYSGPVFGGNDEFWQRSKSETPNLKESVCAICGMKKCNCKDKKHGNAPIKTETKEATTSGSVGAYETPAMWAKSTNKKDWGPSRKTQYPGGGFVKIKNKCNKFPYCNQGDINNLTIVKNKTVKESIINVAKKLGINPNVVITILEHEYETLNKRIK
jgi:hypothetical protein